MLMDAWNKNYVMRRVIKHVGSDEILECNTLPSMGVVHGGQEVDIKTLWAGQDGKRRTLTKCLDTPWSCHHWVSNTLFSP